VFYLVLIERGVSFENDWKPAKLKRRRLWGNRKAYPARGFIQGHVIHGCLLSVSKQPYIEEKRADKPAGWAGHF
jgi:hypothetical protein